MIQYDSKIWFAFLFNFKTGQLRRLFPSMALMGLFTAAICYLDLTLKIYKLEAPLTVHTLLGVVLGLFLVFRTNTAYERWWEGRRLFGALVNSSRNLAVKLDAYLEPNAFEARYFFAEMIAAFAILLPKHLRDELTDEDLEVVVEEERALVKSAFHKPLAVMRSLSSKVQSLRADNKLSHEQFLTLSQNLNELIDALGGMERIKKTPIPFSYAILIKRFIAAYVFSLPLGLVRDFGWASVVIVPFVFYVMVGIEVIAEAIENPFGKDKDDLPTDDIAQNIARNVKEVLNSAYSEPIKERIEGEVFGAPKTF
jgi:putative membrane protein